MAKRESAQLLKRLNSKEHRDACVRRHVPGKKCFGLDFSLESKTCSKCDRQLQCIDAVRAVLVARH